MNKNDIVFDKIKELFENGKLNNWEFEGYALEHSNVKKLTCCYGDFYICVRVGFDHCAYIKDQQNRISFAKYRNVRKLFNIIYKHYREECISVIKQIT